MATKQPVTVTLTVAECKALHEIIRELSGDNPHGVFTWKEYEDDPRDPKISACVKVYRAAGQRVPMELENLGK